MLDIERLATDIVTQLKAVGLTAQEETLIKKWATAIATAVINEVKKGTVTASGSGGSVTGRIE